MEKDKWISDKSIEEFLVVQEFQKLQANQYLDQCQNTNYERNSVLREERKKYLKTLSDEDSNKVLAVAKGMIAQGWKFVPPDKFYRDKDGKETEVIYYPKTNKCTVETTSCVLACCGRMIGEIDFSLENIERTLNNWYEQSQSEVLNNKNFFRVDSPAVKLWNKLRRK